jgi:hypothetical protein
MISQLLAAIRNAKIPLDDVAQTLYKSVHPDLKTPDPKEDTLTLYAPLVAQFMQILKQHTPTQAQASALQSMQQLQDKLNKREQLLQDSGIQYTPTKSASSTQALPIQVPQEQDDDQDQDDSASLLAKMQKLPDDCIKSDAQKLTNHAEKAVEEWLQTFKRIKGKNFEQWMETTISEAKGFTQIFKTQDIKELRKVAFKIGVPYTVASKMGLRSLTKVLAGALTK